MPDETGTVFGVEATEQIAKTVREVSRRMMNTRPTRGRWNGGKGSGGGHEIWFTILSVYCEDAYDDWHLVVEADWYTAGCAKTPPGANDDGTYNIYDNCDKRLFLVADTLPGMTGTATYWYPLTGTCLPKWFLDEICGQPECE